VISTLQAGIEADFEMDLEVEGAVEADDPSALPNDEAGGDNILRTRTYDVSITYDKCASSFAHSHRKRIVCKLSTFCGSGSLMTCLMRHVAGAALASGAARRHVVLCPVRYYQCARVWLYGYSERRQPLIQAEVLEDISADHALKTVTLESHPHLPHTVGLHASLHPCKHASVMHKLCSELLASGRECRPDQYLFLFLKFISSGG